ncbi:hypothetical protein U1Q18_050051 [Sarracenia purpurea var. burkii]
MATQVGQSQEIEKDAETLVRMLLEHTLPVTNLLSSEDEVILRNVLFDAVILVDYSFLDPDKLIHLPNKRLNSLSIARVLLTHEATEFFRGRGDQTKALSYVNGFSGSRLPSQLIKLVTNEIGMHDVAGRPRGLSPKALLKWVVNLEDRGIKLSDDGIAKYKSRLAFEISGAEHEQLGHNIEVTKLDGELHFYIDNKGEGEREREDGIEDEDERAIESMNAAFVAAAHTMSSSAQNGRDRRKRKEGRNIGEKKQVKFQKYKLYDNSGSSGEKSTFLKKDGLSSGSEVENPISDEDTDEEKEK